MKFATSISWRALTYLRYSAPNPHAYSQAGPISEYVKPVPPKIRYRAEKARAEWRRLLLKNGARSTAFSQRLIFLNGKTFDAERFDIMSFTIYHSESLTATHAQLGPLIILGMIRDRSPKCWKNSQIRPKGGVFGVVNQAIPNSYASWLAGKFKAMDTVTS